MRRLLAAALAAAAIGSSPAFAAETPDDVLARAQSLMARGEYRQALDSLEPLGPWVLDCRRCNEHGCSSSGWRLKDEACATTQSSEGLVSLRISRIASRSAGERCANSALVSAPERTFWTRPAMYAFASCGSKSNDSE